LNLRICFLDQSFIIIFASSQTVLLKSRDFNIHLVFICDIVLESTIVNRRIYLLLIGFYFLYSTYFLTIFTLSYYRCCWIIHLFWNRYLITFVNIYNLKQTICNWNLYKISNFLIYFNFINSFTKIINLFILVDICECINNFYR